MNINLHIERMIFDKAGITWQQKNELKAIIATELKQQIIRQNINPTIHLYHNRRSEQSITISLNDTSNTKNLGQKIGSVVHRSIKK